MKLSDFIVILSAICNGGELYHFIHNVCLKKRSVFVYFQDTRFRSCVNSILHHLPYISATNIGTDSDGEHWLEILLDASVIWN